MLWQPQLVGNRKDTRSVQNSPEVSAVLTCKAGDKQPVNRRHGTNYSLICIENQSIQDAEHKCVDQGFGINSCYPSCDSSYHLTSSQ